MIGWVVGLFVVSVVFGPVVIMMWCLAVELMRDTFGD